MQLIEEIHSDTQLEEINKRMNLKLILFPFKSSSRAANELYF